MIVFGQTNRQALSKKTVNKKPPLEDGLKKLNLVD